MKFRTKGHGFARHIYPVRGAQRQKVLRIAKSQGFKVSNKAKITDEGNFVHIRQREPRRFKPSSFRTIDIGRPGFTKLRVGRQLGQETTSVQSILISKKDYGFARPMPKKVRELFKIPSPPRLPIYKNANGKYYFFDKRLQEYRNVKDFTDRIPAEKFKFHR